MNPEDGAAEDAFCGRITAQEPPKDAPAEDASATAATGRSKRRATELRVVDDPPVGSFVFATLG